jgi:hypothetical protein
MAACSLQIGKGGNMPASILWRFGFRRPGVVIGKISLCLIGALSKFVQYLYPKKACISDAAVYFTVVLE